MFPAMLALRGRPCLVVGGGGVALRKVETLLAEGAAVTVVAPTAVARLHDLADQEAIALEQRPYRQGEAARYRLVFAATDDRAINRLVSTDASAAGVWINAVDDPELCTFHVPARIMRGSLQLTVSSGGEAPFAVRRVRQLLARRFGMEWGEWLAAAARFRSRVKETGSVPADQEACFDRFFSATVDTERLRARVASEAEQEGWIGAPGRPDRADASLIEPATAPRRDGSHRIMVWLIGAGPGDPGLMTIRGRQRLLAADAVVNDRLADSVLPCDLPDRVELHCVGKQAGHHPVPQDEINALLVRLASEGKRVARLKGGDPFVFGRGGEEAEALRRAGIPFEVVPGITAGVAVPAFAGIPVTHRKEAVRVTFLTAHETTKSDGPQVRWELLAQDPHATLIGYMGVTSLPNVSRQLIAAGMAPETPAAVIERGSTAAQRTVCGTLETLPALADSAAILPPALFVIGPTVRHAKALDWLSDQPLAGQRLLVPSPGGVLADTLSMAGAEVVEAPLPLTAAARIVVASSPLTGVVLRAPEEVDLLDDERSAAGWREGCAAWCMNEETYARVRALGWPDAARVPGGATLVEALRRGGPGDRSTR